MVGLEPTISRLHAEFHYSCLRSSKQGILNIFRYIRVTKQRNCIRKWQKYELNMSDDGHFEFYDLWENGVFYSLGYGRNGFSTTFSYRNNKKYFSSKMPTGLYLELYFNFLSWLTSNKWIVAQRSHSSKHTQIPRTIGLIYRLGWCLSFMQQNLFIVFWFFHIYNLQHRAGIANEAII